MPKSQSLKLKPLHFTSKLKPYIHNTLTRPLKPSNLDREPLKLFQPSLTCYDSFRFNPFSKKPLTHNNNTRNKQIQETASETTSKESHNPQNEDTITRIPCKPYGKPYEHQQNRTITSSEEKEPRETLSTPYRARI